MRVQTIRSMRNLAEYKRCLLLIAPFRYTYPSWGSVQIFTVGVAEFLAAIPFFLHHLELLQENGGRCDEQKQPGSGGDANPRVDDNHGKVHRVPGKAVNASGKWLVGCCPSDSQRCENKYHHADDKGSQSDIEPYRSDVERQEDRIQGSAYPEGSGYPAHHFSPSVLFKIGGMAGPLGDMFGDNEHRQPLEGEDDHEQPSIPDTYFKSWYKRHCFPPYERY